MSRSEATEISVQSLLESGKEVPRQPDSVRIRALARARAAAAGPLPAVVALNTRPRLPGRLLASGVAAAVVVGVVGSVLALSGGWLRGQPAHRAAAAAAGAPATQVARSVPPSAPEPVVRESPAIAPDAQGVTRAAPSKARHEDAKESYNAELELMRSAHTAYAARDFTSALVLVGEHARRFRGGLLSEEREALRIRCLLGSGRRDQARTAAASFADRFPRSVLLRRLQAEVGANAD